MFKHVLPSFTEVGGDLYNTYWINSRPQSQWSEFFTVRADLRWTMLDPSPAWIQSDRGYTWGLGQWRQVHDCHESGLGLWSDVTDDRLMTGWYLGLAFSGTSRNVLGPGLNWHGLFWRLLRQCPADTNECFRGCSHFRASWCGAVRGWWDQGGGWGWLRPSKIFKDPGMLVKDHHSCFWVCFRHTRWKDKDGTDGACKCLVT
jgi:hypothetical protein